VAVEAFSLHGRGSKQNAEEMAMASAEQKLPKIEAETSQAMTSNRRRLQLDFSPEAFERLALIRKKAGTNSNAELVRNALRLYDWYLDQKQEGYKLQLVKGSEAKQVEIVF
jgi:hypothetical protein